MNLSPSFFNRKANDSSYLTLAKEEFQSRSLIEKLAVLSVIGLTGIGLYNAPLGYADTGWLDSKQGPGRTKNAIATVVSGIVAEKIFPQSEFKFEVEKTWWANSTVDGKTTSGGINSKTDTAFSSATFTARVYRDGDIDGEVDKSEWNWKVKSIGPDVYKIERALLKFDHTLELKISHGQIYGVLQRSVGYDWPISGSYTPEGKVSLCIKVPMGGDLYIHGTIHDLSKTAEKDF